MGNFIVRKVTVECIKWGAEALVILMYPLIRGKKGLSTVGMERFVNRIITSRRKNALKISERSVTFTDLKLCFSSVQFIGTMLLTKTNLALQTIY